MASVKGGDKLQQRINDLASNLGRSTTLSVGFLEDARYPDKAGTQVALVASIHEFGAPKRNIPPRPFFRVMIKQKSPEWGSAISKLLRANDYDAEKTLAKTGDAIKGQLQDSIKNVVGPPLKPATVARKGFATLLIDTSHLLNSVSYNVKP